MELSSEGRGLYESSPREGQEKAYGWRMRLLERAVLAAGSYKLDDQEYSCHPFSLVTPQLQVFSEWNLFRGLFPGGPL